MADVARIAGVSPMTVSRVANGEPRVLPHTREKVQAVIREIGYVPNQAARRLARAEGCRIALLHSNPSAAYLSEFLMGSLDAVSAVDAQLIVEHYAANETCASLIARLAAHRVDAVLMPPPLCDDRSLLGEFRQLGLLTAQIATGAPSPTSLAVSIDDEGAAYAMTRRLLDLGHREIGFILGDPNQTASALRRRGHERALRDAAIVLDEKLFSTGDYSYRSGLAAAEALLAQSPAPTAIFASNDDMAAATVAAAHRRHLEVPADLSVCGFDDTAMATTIWPELTTIRQPIRDMAARATQMLVEAVRSERSGDMVALHHEEVGYTLVVRGSDMATR